MLFFIGDKDKDIPLLRKSFYLENKKVERARVYIAGLGSYELYLNGKKVSEDLFNPMVTRYHKRYMFNTYDITNMLKNGENAFGVILGNGYYSMHTNRVDWQKENWANAPWSDQPKLKLLAYITYEDQSESIISTDDSWKTLKNTLTVDEAYYGEEYDNRLYQKGWNNIGFNDSNDNNAVIVNPPKGNAFPQLAEGCKVIRTAPLKLVYKRDNEYLFDAEKILVGWANITISGNCDDEIEVSYSEWLDDDGNFSDKFLLSPWDLKGRKRKPQTDYFILNGNGEENFAPLFHYKGFRYIRIRTSQGVKINDIKAQVVHADLTHTGNFECSNEFINRLHIACKNSLLNDLHGYPSDTPVYEKLGYLADGYLTEEMAHYNFDAINYYEKWARDIIDQVKDNGYIEQTAPMWDKDKKTLLSGALALQLSLIKYIH